MSHVDIEWINATVLFNIGSLTGGLLLYHRIRNQDNETAVYERGITCNPNTGWLRHYYNSDNAAQNDARLAGIQRLLRLIAIYYSDLQVTVFHRRKSQYSHLVRTEIHRTIRAEDSLIMQVYRCNVVFVKGLLCYCQLYDNIALIRFLIMLTSWVGYCRRGFLGTRDMDCANRESKQAPEMM